MTAKQCEAIEGMGMRVRAHVVRVYLQPFVPRQVRRTLAGIRIQIRDDISDATIGFLSNGDIVAKIINLAIPEPVVCA